MKNKSTRWLILSQTLYVDAISNRFISIYDTKSATHMTSTDRVFINLINQFFIPENIGSIKFNETIISKDFEKAKSLGYIYIIESNKKPINLLPILSLQSDILRTSDIDQRISLVGSKLSLLSGLKIALAPMMNTSRSKIIARKRKAALNQYCMYTKADERFIYTENLLYLLERINLTSVAAIDLYCNKSCFQNNILIKRILNIIPQNVNINIHIDVEDFFDVERIVNSLIPDRTIHVKMYADEYTEIKYIYSYKKSCYDIYYFVYSEESLNRIVGLEEKLKFCPVVLDDNVEWIRKEFSLNSETIIANANSFNHIFRNMRLNANFFGIIDISTNGNVMPHGSNAVIGNLADKRFSLIDVVVAELKNNNTWRKTRNLHNKCSMCAFRYLCPPLTIFEIHGLLDTICMSNSNVMNPSI